MALNLNRNCEDTCRRCRKADYGGCLIGEGRWVVVSLLMYGRVVDFWQLPTVKEDA